MPNPHFFIVIIYQDIFNRAMGQISAYLTFNGNCREAMTFYKHCLGGELTFQTIGESPLASKMPKEMRDCILHAKLEHEGMVLMGSDMVGDKGLIKGNAVSMVLNCKSAHEIERLYTVLSQDGERLHPIEVSVWGALFGDLVDRYGNHWLLHCERSQN
jgi:PhnB protein